MKVLKLPITDCVAAPDLGPNKMRCKITDPKHPEYGATIIIDTSEGAKKDEPAKESK